MIDYILILPILISFFVTWLLMPFWIRKAKQIGLVWDDMNKIKSDKIVGSGGLLVVLGFILGLLVFIAYRVFYLKTDSYLIEILSIISVILILAGVGLVDDLFGWRHGGLSRRSRLILVGLAAIPLMAINAGRHIVSIPFLGYADLGIVYPLVLIPIGIIGATTTYNFLAGFNGLEAGQGILLLLGISFVAYFTGNSWLAVICFCMIAPLIAFLTYNFYPAKVFPGDILTYSIGGLIAVVSIIGNFEKIALFFFIPYILEVILKSRGKLIKQSFGEPQKDGSLKLKYEKLYGLTHVSIFLLEKLKIKPTEKNAVYTIWIFQTLVIVLGIILFREGIFI